MRMRWLFGLAVTGLLFGCGPKVDCDKLHKRLQSCTKELMFTLRPDAAKRLKTADPEVKKHNEKLLAEDIKRNQDTLKKQVTDKCKAKKGRAADAKLINKCLEKKTCGEFAACFGVYLKDKGK